MSDVRPGSGRADEMGRELAAAQARVGRQRNVIREQHRALKAAKERLQKVLDQIDDIVTDNSHSSAALAEELYQVWAGIREEAGPTVEEPLLRAEQKVQIPIQPHATTDEGWGSYGGSTSDEERSSE